MSDSNTGIAEHNSPWARVPVGLEESEGGYVHAHALTIPGLMTTGSGAEDALGAFQRMLPRWLGLLADIGEPLPSPDQEIDIVVDEWVTTDGAVAAGETDAFFRADEVPLTDAEIRRGLALIGEMRAPLLPRIRRAKDEELEGIPAGDTHVRLVLDELARAQWWLLTRLGASPLGLVPDTAVGRLDTAMALAIDRLAHLPMDARGQVVELDGERWSPRKVLRRMVGVEATLGDLALRALQRHAGADHLP
ncbi:MAG: type II toxin-antitoxin system HicB family antitoxin [Gemmatimonadota bacterium]|jgi:predicted RNase H-like HicB family nuclease|nr:type II toxin-antitoxin system HicB family antitoxin [Gemmatimonadota bacterium]